jgi:hypothetical protein
LSRNSLRFHITSAINLQSDTDILIVLDNHAKSLNLLSNGNIFDQPGSGILVAQTAVLSGVDVVFGDGPGECFDVLSDVYAVFASGISDVTQGCQASCETGNFATFPNEELSPVEVGFAAS